MRILLVNHEFTITGASTILLRLAEHLRSSGHEIAILPFNPAHGPIKERYLALGFPVLESAVFGDYDLVICNTTFTAAVLVQAAPHTKTVWWVHEAESGGKFLLSNLPLLSAFNDATAVAYDMPFQRDVVFRSFTYHLDPQKFFVIPCGVEIDSAPLVSDRVAPKRRAIRIVSVGTVEPRKRHEDLIRAVHRLERPDIECVICGLYFHLPADALKIVQDAPDQFTVISGLPEREPLAWVNSADIFCLASASETQAIAAYEAALMAKPLVLSDLPAYNDIFVHGRNCLKFPPGDVEMLAQSLATLAGSRGLRERLGHAARETARRYTVPAFHAEFDALLNRVVP
jgi:glycosyltransferase involved in cell wall biosynthesis